MPTGGDGRGPDNWPSRREKAVQCLGAELEGLLSRFLALRIRCDSLPALLDEIGRMNDSDRALLAIELADFWDKFCDSGAYYYGVERWDKTLAITQTSDPVAFAERLAHSVLGDMLELGPDELPLHERWPGIPVISRPCGRK